MSEAQWYYCPTAGMVYSTDEDFNCCDKPELHQTSEELDQVYRLQRNAELDSYRIDDPQG